MRRLGMLWLYLMLVLPCDAAIYQWTDSTGAVQFGDQPPPGRIKVIERRDIEASVAAAPGVPPAPPSIAPAATPPERPQPPRRHAARTTEREQARQRCDKLRQRIDRTQAQLRAGYSARRGIALTERLRADRDQLYHDCRYGAPR